MKVLAVPSDEEFDSLPPALRRKVCAESYFFVHLHHLWRLARFMSQLPGMMARLTLPDPRVGSFWTWIKGENQEHYSLPELGAPYRVAF